MKIAAVIPCYKVAPHIAAVVRDVGPHVWRIYLVDDACPEGSLDGVAPSEQVVRLRHGKNEGVGAATLTGMRQAFADGADIAIKLDGDGQMDASDINSLVAPVVWGDADYAKGNRFYDPESLAQMPMSRIIGNAALSFMSKLSGGYWDIFDPTNGFVALHRSAFQRLPLAKISRRYFFESDLLFRLYLARAVVRDVPLPARYANETSNLRIGQVIGPFLGGHCRNALKRIIYSYFVRDFSMASLSLLLGLILTLGGLLFGASEWIRLAHRGITASAGTVMLAGLPIILGFQLLLSFLTFDMANMPRYPLQKLRALRPDASLGGSFPPQGKEIEQ